MAPAQWNQYGALSSTAGYSQRQPTLLRPSAAKPFKVYVDNDCIDRNKEVEREIAVHEQNHRLIRDDRTFKDHNGSTVAEKLTQDPLRYVKDPNKLEKDHPTLSRTGMCSRSKVKESSQSLICNFLTDTSCEEERFLAGYYKILSSCQNFNMLYAAKQNTRVICTSVGDCTKKMHTKNPLLELKLGELEKEKQAEICSDRNKETIHQVHIDEIHSFHQYNSPTPRNTSTASSTVVEVMAVGVDVPTVEQTINTAWAQKEISMMFFGSPAKDVHNSFGHVCHISNEKEIVKDSIYISTELQDESILVGDSSNDPNSSFAPFSYNNTNQEFNPDSFPTKGNSPISFQIYEDVLPAAIEEPVSTFFMPQSFHIYKDIGECTNNKPSALYSDFSKSPKIFRQQTSFDNVDTTRNTSVFQSTASVIIEGDIPPSFSVDFNIASKGENLLNDSGNTATWSIIEEAFKEL
jgi:hypothetical protein